MKVNEEKQYQNRGQELLFNQKIILSKQPLTKVYYNSLHPLTCKLQMHFKSEVYRSRFL